MKRKYNFVNLFLLLSFVVFSFLALVEEFPISGKATVDVPSNVSIVNYLAIDFSYELANGIVFNDILFLPATNVDALENYNGTGNGSGYFIRVSPDGNTPVDFCLKASGDLISSGGDSIPLVGETYAHSNLFSNTTIPSLDEEISLTTNYVMAGEQVPVGERSYMRFWLDVSAGQAAGQYNNSIFFKGIPSGIGC